MRGHDSNAQIDPLLMPFIQTSDDVEAQHQLDQLVAHAAPLIKKVTDWGCAPEDAFQETAQHLIKRLWDLKTVTSDKAISNYRHYVKVVASHVVKGHVRKERLQHRGLVDALRGVLKRRPAFELWESEKQEILCGLAAWREQPTALTRSERLIRLLDDPRTFDEVVLPGRDAGSLDYAELLTEIFNWVGHAMRFDELVRIVCDLKRVQEFTPVIEGDEGEVRPSSELLPDVGWRPDEQAEWSEFLEQLWEQIEQLPLLQRLAYLLNFTAADGQVELFWRYGVTTIRRIGALLQLTEEQFARVWPELPLNDDERCRAVAFESYDDKFALLWHYLPLTDAAIARMLGTERQKVINLRKAAGDRLSRRLAHRVPRYLFRHQPRALTSFITIQ